MIDLIKNYYRHMSRYDDWRNKERLTTWWIKKAYYEAGQYQPFKI